MYYSMNSIRLAGRVHTEPMYDHTVFGEAFYHMEIAAARLSGTDDILPVTVSERLLGDPEVNSCDAGAPISVSGQIRSYNLREGERNRLIITVFARDVGFPQGGALPFDDEDGDQEGAEDGVPEGEPMRRDVNEAELCGAVCKPVIYRTTPFSREIADVLIAVNRRYGKSDYLPCIAWGRNARFAAGLEVGDRILVRGRMQSREYQKKLPDGTAEQRTAYEISCSSIERREY